MFHLVTSCLVLAAKLTTRANLKAIPVSTNSLLLFVKNILNKALWLPLYLDLYISVPSEKAKIRVTIHPIHKWPPCNFEKFKMSATKEISE